MGTPVLAIAALECAPSPHALGEPIGAPARVAYVDVGWLSEDHAVVGTPPNGRGG